MTTAFVRIAIAGSVFLCAIPLALATLMVPLSIPQLAAESDLIVHGKVISITTTLDADRRIVTRVLTEITETWKGQHPGARLQVVLAGGTLGTKQVVVDGQPEYRPDEEVVLFLKLNQRKEAVTVGLAQGKFVVWTNPATGRKEVHNPFQGRAITGARQTEGRNSQETTEEQSLSLAELKRMVVRNPD
ncbi:MAG TPA: hypothetical protein PLW35_02355 [Verrucomicrobiota bacterium]|nr:hypothetical protein [Verrucomicrobiota bacterium]